MSIDLRQFFTTDYVPHEFKGNSIENFILNLFSFLPQATIDETTEYLDEDEVAQEEFLYKDFLVDHVFADIIPCCGLERILLASFFEMKDLIVSSDDGLMNQWYDMQNNIFVELDDKYVPQVKKIFESLPYHTAIEWCKYDGSYDDYSMNVARLRLSHIRFRNKSLARKFRKLYKKHYEIRAMLDEFNFGFQNGQLISWRVSNIECDGCEVFETDLSVLNDAVNILGDASGKIRNETEELEFTLYALSEAPSKRMNIGSLIEELISSLKSNEEVIM